MRKVLLVFSVFFVSVILFSDGVIAQNTAQDFTARGARIYHAKDGNSLTLPSALEGRQVAKGFLTSKGFKTATLESLSLQRENKVAKTGYTHLLYEQQVDGLRVYGTYVKASINSQGELVSLIENLPRTSSKGVVPTTIGVEDALGMVLKHHYSESNNNFQASELLGNKTIFYGGDFFNEELSVTRIAIPMTDGALHAGYLVVTWDSNNILRHTVVGGNGRIVAGELRTNSDSYNIFTNHPGVTGQTVVSGPGAGNAESPIGWVTSNTTIGNNVDAYLDRDNNNAPDPGGRPISATTGASADFLTTANLTQAPTTNQNQLVAVQNLFYTTNFIHDKLYRHGFTESAGNFQTNNFNIGGSGNDPVNAEAQDGGGTNNANFATPSDGSRPRMQMYIWTQSNPNRDGDLDSDIVYHEYGHGLTWRMIGGMSGPMSGAIGEGMSDVLAILINNNDTVGEYSFNNSNGIRSAPYTNYSRTYGNFGGNSVHSDGEIYAATIWRLWELFQIEGIPQDTLFDYLIGGMNFTPSGPAMEDMRDGILQAANGSGNECTIWNAFAQFGIGEGASVKIRGRKVTINESFNVPSECDGGNPGGDINLSVSLTTRGPTRANLSWTGGATSNVDIRRNGTLITTTANDGDYRDNINNVGSGPFTYQVCEAGSTTTCSNNVTVTP